MSGVLQRVPSRHRKRSVFLQPREDKDHAPVEVDWPKDVVKIYKCLNPSKISGYTIFYNMRSTKNKFVVEAVKAGSITLFISQRSSQTLRSLKVLVLMVKNVKSDPIFAHYLKPDVQVEDVQEVTSIREAQVPSCVLRLLRKKSPGAEEELPDKPAVTKSNTAGGLETQSRHPDVP
ncbi:hypothetical protein PPTG_07015 [Phytophthora nicotianae INRA-310]|uniref:Uncharacterized protein n=1 Tax=Phytophthora nicotianae (strain INRA-310) TaxID=761204 RepID=W2QTL0_PHYN3|nr:hypothetical protein PPTG_07015 [Phytophthora nicotianae INRA-310]ETN15824.1 hypothetical protein PPTG_07015 [Phytophthora nicotianae INRA-310]